MESEVKNYPLRFAPIYKDYIWGGDRIPKTYGRKLSPGIYAESWEISDRPEGMSVVSNGRLAGKSLHELVVASGADLVGTASDVDVFPLLVKLIDSRECLSVQVHPGDANAASAGGEPKTEMWYVLAADSGAKVFAGLKRGVDRAKFEKAIREGNPEDMLNALPVSTGDSIFVPAGRVHAIGGGCLLLEVQQNSNTAYRVYDWGRKGSDGKPRPLHIEQALRVIDWSDHGQKTKLSPRKTADTGANTTWNIVECRHFRVEKLELSEPLLVRNDGRSFHALFTAQGRVRIDCADSTENMKAGVSCLLPAAVSQYTLVPDGGPAQVLRASLP